MTERRNIQKKEPSVFVPSAPFQRLKETWCGTEKPKD